MTLDIDIVFFYIIVLFGPASSNNWEQDIPLASRMQLPPCQALLVAFSWTLAYTSQLAGRSPFETDPAHIASLCTDIAIRSAGDLHVVAVSARLMAVNFSLNRMSAAH